jgi:hypothetical protein
VRFTAGDTSVDVTIGADNATTRDLLSMLPLTVTFEEFNGREKIGYLPRRLNTTGSPGSEPDDNHLIYYVPWGNLGFYYNTAGVAYSVRSGAVQIFHKFRAIHGFPHEELAGRGMSVSVEAGGRRTADQLACSAPRHWDSARLWPALAGHSRPESVHTTAEASRFR